MICHGEKKLLPTEFGSQKSCCSKLKSKQSYLILKILLKNFPSQKKLSEASEDQVLAAWSGLGFYRRARNIFATKEIIKNNYGNRFPNEFQQIIELPGIGKSTAGAIMSLAYLDPHPILDGNVKRVISRFLKKDLDLLKEAELWKLSQEMLMQR